MENHFARQLSTARTYLRGRSARLLTALAVLATLSTGAASAHTTPDPDAPITFDTRRDEPGRMIHYGGKLAANATGSGRVQAYWERGVIHLTFTSADGSGVVNSTAFERIDGKGEGALGAPVATIFDVRGVYRAELRDVSGMPVGWMRVRIDDATPVYDGIVPAGLAGPMLASAVALLDADIDAIEAPTTDVHLGN